MINIINIILFPMYFVLRFDKSRLDCKHIVKIVYVIDRALRNYFPAFCYFMIVKRL